MSGQEDRINRPALAINGMFERGEITEDVSGICSSRDCENGSAIGRYSEWGEDIESHVSKKHPCQVSPAALRSLGGSEGHGRTLWEKVLCGLTGLPLLLCPAHPLPLAELCCWLERSSSTQPFH